MVKPLIGLTPTPQILEMEHGTFRRHALSDNYSLAIEAVGGIPVMLPAHFQDIEAIVDRLDGMIITGGGDIDPARYGQDRHETTDGIDDERDAFELAIIDSVNRRKMPLLGICRGLQILNVALGGTLYQDIDDLVPDHVQHRQQNERIHHEETSQKATLVEGDHPLRRLAGKDAIDINTFHHQSIANLAEPLLPMAYAEDGVIEAVYYPTMPFCMAVQWHPEMLAMNHKEHAAIFEAFVDAASTYRTERHGEEVSNLA